MMYRIFILVVSILILAACNKEGDINISVQTSAPGKSQSDTAVYLSNGLGMDFGKTLGR